MSGIDGTGGAAIAGAGNDINGGIDTTISNIESSVIGTEANAGVAANQGTNQQQAAANAQNSMNAAQGAVQTNEQNAGAGNAVQVAADQSNQNVEAAALAAAEEKARHEEVMSAIGSFQ